MAHFSSSSKKKLLTCAPELVSLFLDVIKEYDCTILEGERTAERQEALFAEGKTKVHYPDSSHNSSPSEAVDVAPYIKGKGVSFDLRQCSHFSGYVQARADELGISIRWGGDWDGDRDVNDQSFNDLVHFELN